MSESAVDGFLRRFEERNQEMAEKKAAWWASLSNVEKAEWLLRGVDPAHVFERDMPRLALAQVHATLALSEKPKT